MAALDTTRSLGVSGQTGSLFSKIGAYVVAWNEARVTRNSLNALTDRELDDIGLIRGDIDMVAYGMNNR